MQRRLVEDTLAAAMVVADDAGTDHSRSGDQDRELMTSWRARLHPESEFDFGGLYLAVVGPGVRKVGRGVVVVVAEKGLPPLGWLMLRGGRMMEGWSCWLLQMEG